MSNGVETSELYGSIAGSGPDWQHCNWHDNGKLHVKQCPPALLSQTGIGQWAQQAAGNCESVGRRHFTPPGPSASVAEPAVQRGHTSYYNRRAGGDFRRSLRAVSEPSTPDRADRKRWLVEPHGPPPHLPQAGMLPETAGGAAWGGAPPPEAPTGIYRRQGPPQASQPGPEPDMPHLARPWCGMTCLRETNKEFHFESTMGRKVRVGQRDYRHTGRAGDLSLRYGPTSRPEDEPSYFKSMKEAPTFVRYCNSLPDKAAVSPHERRLLADQRRQDAETSAAQHLVKQLAQWPDGQADD